MMCDLYSFPSLTYFLDYYGLKSPGLTCYLNSVLQVLFMTENFRDALKRFEKKTLFGMFLNVAVIS